MNYNHKLFVSLALGVLLSNSPPALGKTVTGQTGKTADETSVIGVAGPAPRKTSGLTDKSPTQPSRKVLRKAKITPPPPMHDPN